MKPYIYETYFEKPLNFDIWLLEYFEEISAEFNLNLVVTPYYKPEKGQSQYLIFQGDRIIADIQTLIMGEQLRLRVYCPIWIYETPKGVINRHAPDVIIRFSEEMEYQWKATPYVSIRVEGFFSQSREDWSRTKEIEFIPLPDPKESEKFKEHRKNATIYLRRREEGLKDYQIAEELGCTPEHLSRKWKKEWKKMKLID